MLTVLTAKSVQKGTGTQVVLVTVLVTVAKYLTKVT